MGVPGLEDLPGTKLAEGSFTVTEEDERQVRQVIGGTSPTDGTAHPLWAYIATQRGIGISIRDLCALADFDVDDGPMLGSTEMEYLQPILLGVSYRVTGEVLDIERKNGRSGTFDVMSYREELVREDGERVASSTSTFILPRRDLP
jgi:hypothetical protein